MPASTRLHLHRRVFPLFVACTFALAGCNHETSQSLVNQAAASLKAGDRKAAIILLKSAVQKDEKNAEARFQLGKLQYDQDDFIAAEKEFRRARAAGFARDTINPLLAQTWIRLGHYQQVLDEIPRPPAGSPGEAGYWLARANAQLGLKKIDEAKQELAHAVALAPNGADTQLTMARLSLLDGKRDEALVQIDAAIHAAPTRREAWLFKGDVLRASGKFPEAEAAYQAVLKIDPGHLGARLAIASIALADNRIADAKTQVGVVLKAAPGSLLGRYTQAMIDFREKKFAAAREHLAGVIKAAPNYLPAVLLNGSIEYALGNMLSAETQFNKVVAAIPDHVYARRLLAVSQLRQARPDDAARTLAPLNPDSSDDAGVRLVAGEIALAQKHYELASRHFERAAQIDPNSAAIRTELGISRLAQGDDRAQADLRAAAGFSGETGRADTVLLLNQLKNRQFDAALASAALLEKKQPKSPAPWNYRGAAYLGKKDRANARASFEAAQKLSPSYYPAVANLARLDLEDKQPTAARARFEAFLKTNPGHLQAMLALAELALRQQKDEQAFTTWLDKASSAHPQAIEPRELLARYYLAKRAYAKAVAQAREAVNAQPNNPAALDLLGATQFASQDMDNALGTYRKLVDLYPAQVQPRLKLAQVQLAMKQPDAARLSLQNALRIRPDWVEAQMMLGGIEIQGAHYDDAQKLARQIQQKSPSNPAGFILEGDAAFARKDYPAALSAFERAYTLGPSGALLVRQQRILSVAGRSEEGEKRLTSWLATKPQDVNVRAALAESLLQRKQYQAAAAQYLRLNQDTPNNLLVLNNLAWTLQQSGDKRAGTYAEQALKLKPDSPAVMDTLGWILVQSGQAGRGLTLLQQALSKAPDAADIQYHLAMAYIKTGDRGRARNELERLLAGGVAFPQEQEARALLGQLQGKTR